MLPILQAIAVKVVRLIPVMIGVTFSIVVLTSCTPGDVQYCRGFGVEGTPEYGKCISYYHQQETAFRADWDVCSLSADGTYPPSLYDFGHDVPVAGGFGPYGTYYGGGIEHIPPDYQHNAQVDALRMRIIEPCMQARGWNSGSSWQAGRHAVSATPKLPLQKMPWQ